MGCILKLIDAILFLFFLFMAIVAPLIDAQSCLPNEYYPKALLDLNAWYSSKVGDYVVVEKPSFYVGLVWMELLVIWPLSITNLFAMVTSKTWFSTTCLIYGVSWTTAMVAIISELIGSGKASDTLKMVYYPFMGLAILALIRGLIPSSCKTSSIGKRPALAARKKRS